MSLNSEVDFDMTVELCTCMAQMVPHDKMPNVCPVPRVGVEWAERKPMWGDPNGGRHSTRVNEGMD